MAGSTATWIVRARSAAEIPVVTPVAASIETHEAGRVAAVSGRHHQRQVELVAALLGEREADQAARLTRHERDRLGASRTRPPCRGRPRPRGRDRRNDDHPTGLKLPERTFERCRAFRERRSRAGDDSARHAANRLNRCGSARAAVAPRSDLGRRRPAGTRRTPRAARRRSRPSVASARTAATIAGIGSRSPRAASARARRAPPRPPPRRARRAAPPAARAGRPPAAAARRTARAATVASST